MKDQRPDWDHYFMNITRDVAERSNCLCVKIGAVIVKNRTIISTGYVGAPRKTKDCISRGSCLRRELGIPSGHRYELCRSVHAEQNAIINAAREGTVVLGSDLYIHARRVLKGEDKVFTSNPCFICKKTIINAGIANVIMLTEDNKIKRVSVEQWQKEWTEKDMIDDIEIYDAKWESKEK